MHESLREIARLRNKLNEKLGLITETEEYLKELKIGYEFKLEVEPGKFISWEKTDEKSSRLHVHDTDLDPPFMPLRQTKVETRLFYLKYMDKFLKEFAKSFSKLLDNNGK